MSVFDSFDIDSRKKKIENLFNGVPMKSADDFPVIAATPCYFGFGGTPRSTEYWTDPKTMLSFQTDAYVAHLENVEDDFIPYFMPWFGTGVLASAFGCGVNPATGNGDDPSMKGHIVNTPEEAAKLKKPDPFKDGLMPTVIKFMEYAAEHGDMPVGLTDMNSPFSTLCQICGYENVFVWSYEEPELIDDLMSMICEAFTEWTKVQKQITGAPYNMSYGLQGIWTPKGGVWMSDDDLVTIGADFYEEFIAPHYAKVFEQFGGGHLHYCGKGTHQLRNIAKLPITAVNNSPLGGFKEFAALANGLPKGLVLEIQDGACIEPEEYYKKLFADVESVENIMIATFVPEKTGMLQDGGYVAVEWNAFEHANRMVKAARAAVAEKLNK